LTPWRRMGCGCIDPQFLDLGTGWMWVVSFMPWPLYAYGKSPRYPLDRRLGGPQSWSGRHGEVKILASPGLELGFLRPPARSQSLYRLSYPSSPYFRGKGSENESYTELNWLRVSIQLPITVATLSKAWNVFPRSNTGIVDSNPTKSTDVCLPLVCVCVVLCVGSGLATGWSPVQGVLPTV
jgi:hypothetical protein